MIITEIHENGVQPGKLGLTESYVDTFWRHGKQLLKGAAVLGAGILGYGAWRYATRESLVTANENHNDVALNARTHSLSRRQASNCFMGTPVGEFQINTYTAYDQAYPAITALADGGVVVVWQTNGQDGDNFGIYGQRYAASGAALGTEFRINTYTTSAQTFPDITALQDEGFVVVWQGAGQDGGDIYGQRYAASGAALGTEFQINTYTTSTQISPSITALADGNFVVVWESLFQDGSEHGIYGQRYAASGSALGSEFRVNTYTTDRQGFATITGLLDGGFVVVWQSYFQNASYHDIYGQRYAASGLVLGSEFRINTYIAHTQGFPAITALPDGSFVVVWQSVVQNGTSYHDDIYGRRYAASGAALGIEFQINTYTPGYQTAPDITALRDGSFVVVWQGQDDGASSGIYAQHYTASGIPIRSEFLVNTNTMDDQVYPAITGLMDGSFMVAWQSKGQDGSDYGIYGQRYWAAIRVWNSCDASYTEDINYSLGLWLGSLAYMSSLNVSLMLQPAASGQLMTTAHSADAIATYDSILGRWQGTGHFAGIDSLLRGLQFIPTLNYNEDVHLDIIVNDDAGSAFTGNFSLTGIPVNDAPVWIKNQLAISQGATRHLTLADLWVSDVDTPNSNINISVTALQSGKFIFIWQPNIAITTFTQQDIDRGAVAFVHDGVAAAPSYALSATDGILVTPGLLVNIDFNLKPSIVNNAIAIQKPGETILLTNIQILAIDNDNLPSQLLFTVSNIKEGKFQIATNLNEAATTFTQLDINNGLVRFIHDGSQKAPSYKLIVTDGRMSSEASDATVNFNLETKTKIPFTETTGFKSGISIAITAGGTLAGFAAWRYRNDQDAKRRRQQSLIANIIRDDLNLAGVHDFTSERGVELLEAIAFIGEKVKEKNISIIGMTRDEKEIFAHKLAECLKAYVSHTPPKDILDGNIVTQPTRHLYYQKIKPLIKPGVGWLDTDAVKKAADVIAENVKVKLNEQDQDIESGSTNTKGNKSSVMMQPLLSHN